MIDNFTKSVSRSRRNFENASHANFQKKSALKREVKKKAFLNQSKFRQHTVEREITGSTKIAIVLEVRPELFAVLRYIGLSTIQPRVNYTRGNKTANLKFRTRKK